MSDECYACMVGVWTGPESHSEGCQLSATSPTPEAVRHIIRTGDGDENDRYRWECSCGTAGSSENPDIHSDRHIDYDRGDRRVDSSKSLDDPWDQDVPASALRGEA